MPLPERKRLAKITTLSVAPLIGEAIRRIHRGESVGALFSSEVSLTQEMVLWEGGDEGTIDTRGGEPGDDPPVDRRGRRRLRDRRRCRVRPGERPMTLKLHRPDGEGGLEPRPVVEPDWRSQLQSPRWGTALEGERLPELKNPEMNPTSRMRSVLFWLGLGVATFLLIVDRLRQRVLEAVLGRRAGPAVPESGRDRHRAQGGLTGPRRVLAYT